MPEISNKPQTATNLFGVGLVQIHVKLLKSLLLTRGINWTTTRRSRETLSVDTSWGACPTTTTPRCAACHPAVLLLLSEQASTTAQELRGCSVGSCMVRSFVDLRCSILLLLFLRRSLLDGVRGNRAWRARND